MAQKRVSGGIRDKMLSMSLLLPLLVTWNAGCVGGIQIDNRLVASSNGKIKIRRIECNCSIASLC